MKKKVLFSVCLTVLMAVNILNSQELPVTTPSPGGTSGYIPFWHSTFSMSSTSLVNSNIFKSDNNIGIGTNNPLCRLQIGGNESVRIGIGTLDAGMSETGKSYIGFNLIRVAPDKWQTDNYWSKGGSVIMSILEGGFYFITIPDNISNSGTYTDSEIQNSIRMSIDPTGNVGIGTGTLRPQSKLHVDGNITVPFSFVLSRYERSWGENQTRTIMKNSWTLELGDYLYLGSTGNNSNLNEPALLLTQFEGIKFGKGHDNANALSAEWMRINNNGCVGIGILPIDNNKLSVGGNVTIGTTNSNANLKVNGSTSLVNENGINSFQILGNSGIPVRRGISISNDPQGELSFYINSNQSNASFKFINGMNNQSLMTINQFGNVGIGTTNFNNGAYKLAVNGTIHAKEIFVDMDNWSDFVFDEDYKLKTLADLEKFIIEFKHLPDIPSNTEVKENGVNLGNMDALLLLKLEEMTLYVIELQKQIDDLNEKVESK
jgi:hypothetical protein